MTPFPGSVRLVEGDITAEFDWAIRDHRQVAWDIETSGLSWQSDKIATCQLHVDGVGTQIVRIEDHVPDRLRELLISERVLKVFHHAPFDLRFMRHHWSAVPRHVACTKILSKLVGPELDPKEHSLKPALKRYLNVDIDKRQQTSDWNAVALSDEQILYAARDVEFLFPLFSRMMDEARGQGVADIAERTFAYIPVRIETDIRGCGDVFAY